MKLNTTNRRTLVCCLNSPKMLKAVEVGVSRGQFSKYILENTQMSLDSVDPWEFNSEQATPEASYAFCQTLLAPFGNRSRMVKAYSPAVSKEYADNDLDFVYIDGAHDYESVKQDMEAWYPKLKQNRILAGHDYNTLKWPGVVQAVNEFCQTKGLKFYLTGIVGNAMASRTGDLDEYDGDEQSWVIIKP